MSLQKGLPSVQVSSLTFQVLNCSVFRSIETVMVMVIYAIKLSLQLDKLQLWHDCYIKQQDHQHFDHWRTSGSATHGNRVDLKFQAL